MITFHGLLDCDIESKNRNVFVCELCRSMVQVCDSYSMALGGRGLAIGTFWGGFWDSERCVGGFSDFEINSM